MLRGRCLCGGLEWEIEGPLRMMAHCHCRRCRKAHGTGYATWAAGPVDSFRFIGGEDLLGSHGPEGGSLRRFCTRCGSAAPGSPRGNLQFVPVGNVEGDPGGRPEVHIYVASKARWDTIADELPQIDSGGLDRPEAPDPPSRTPSREGAMPGSCLCGRVVFEVSGELRAIVKCHCSRCRHSRGAAHGANLFIASPRLEWITGRDAVRHYRPPDAAAFTVGFCRGCGSLLPRDPVPGKPLAVPAGCLDVDPGADEKLHIFVDSKAPWVTIADDLTQFAEGPAPLPEAAPD